MICSENREGPHSICYAAGVAIAKDPALPAASALLTFSNVTLTIVNSSLQHIATDLDAVLGLYNSTVSFINSTFTNNTAKTSGGLLAQKMMGVSIANCVFENSTGIISSINLGHDAIFFV